MPPRLSARVLIPLLPGSAGPAHLSHQSLLLSRPFSHTSPHLKSSSKKPHKSRDPYAVAQSRALKASNLARQASLKKERASSLGDPVHGTLTPFVKSFDELVPHSSASDYQSSFSHLSSSPRPTSSPPSSATTSPGFASRPETHLNHFVTNSDLSYALLKSQDLTSPLTIPSPDPETPDSQLEAQHADETAKHALQHQRAEAAITRILNLSNSSNRDRTRVNIQRCISTFGRHHTDKILRPRAPANIPGSRSRPGKTPRAGPDTGSSEVQVAILTAKIRVLANHLATKGKQDKVNKRNLRLLVHKRQKHLAYLRRKERGGERWTNLVEQLGLTDGTWKGEITM